jgi:hypothetical protein
VKEGSESGVREGSESGVREGSESGAEKGVNGIARERKSSFPSRSSISIYLPCSLVPLAPKEWPYSRVRDKRGV